jgi:4'-phosphopantetheinyl transferase
MTVARVKSGCVQVEPGLRISVHECGPIGVAEETHTLESDEIHVWHAEVSAIEASKLASRSLLSEDEISRMQRFHFEKDRQNFIFCRSMLRILLASYLGSSPAELRFAYSAHGKPSLATSSDGLEFNLSHSNGNLLAAIALDRKVGVDIECLNRDLNVLEISRRFFSATEKHAIEILPEDLQHEAFFSCWTRKEAFVKARGEGLSLSLDCFDVSIIPENEAVSLATRPEASAASGWALHSLNCFPGYRAAVAVEKKRNESFGI